MFKMFIINTTKYNPINNPKKYNMVAIRNVYNILFIYTII